MEEIMFRALYRKILIQKVAIGINISDLLMYTGWNEAE